MPTRLTTRAAEVLATFCHDLRLLREQAGGPSVRVLAARVGLGKSQVDAILNGRIRRPPEWHVVRGMVDAFYGFARDSRRLSQLSITAGLDEYWRPRHALLEYALTQPPAAPATGAANGTGASADPVAVVPRQLPPIAPHLVGRAPELATLTRAAGPPVSARGPLLITGMAGVGKTTLAVAWAHRVASQFPDGQLYVNLRGFDPSRPALTPAQVVRLLLLGLGVPPAELPPGFEAQVGLYRSLLSERRVLVLLDDVCDADQVRVLLPGCPACLALVTSRVELTALVAADGAYPVTLDVLPDRDARQMLAQRLGVDRVGAEPDAVRELIDLCGRLPIALATVAARAATRPDFPLSAIAEDAGRVLRGSGMADGGDPSSDVWAVFASSYGALPAQAARLFRLLGLHVGTDIGLPAAASLVGAPEANVRQLLSELTRAHLITESHPGRYGIHDLLRAFAMDLAEAEETEQERAAARRRSLDHYVHTAFHAAMLISPGRAPITLQPFAPDVRPERLADRNRALAWFAAERDVLLAAAESAGTTGHHRHAWKLGWAVADFLELRGHFEDWIMVQGHAVAAARQLAEPETLARMLLILGNACARAGRLDDAAPHLREALDLFGRTGQMDWRARAENTLGEVMEQQGRYAEALGCAQRSLVLYQQVGDPVGEARAHNSIGWCHARLGAHRQAVAHCGQAMVRYRGLADPNGLAASWDSLGYAHHGLRQYHRAVECYLRALELNRDLGARFQEAMTLDHLAGTHAAAGDHDGAQRAWRQALAIYVELGHPEAAKLRPQLAAQPG